MTDTRFAGELVARIEQALPAKIQEATAGGSMHPLWESIFDFEGLKAGRETLARGTPLEVLRSIARAFGV